MTRPHMPERSVGFTRAQPLRGDSFEAWHQTGTAIDVSAATTLEEAKIIAARESGHKCRFVIQHNRADARRFWYIFYVSKSTVRGTYRRSRDTGFGGFGPSVFEGNLEIKAEFSMQVLSPLVPVAPWQWSAEDYMGEKHGICPDLVGVDRQLVEHVK